MAHATIQPGAQLSLPWPDPAKALHADWWQARIARQKEIDASIAAKAEPWWMPNRCAPRSP